MSSPFLVLTCFYERMVIVSDGFLSSLREKTLTHAHFAPPIPIIFFTRLLNPKVS